MSQKGLQKHLSFRKRCTQMLAIYLKLQPIDESEFLEEKLSEIKGNYSHQFDEVVCYS